MIHAVQNIHGLVKSLGKDSSYRKITIERINGLDYFIGRDSFDSQKQIIGSADMTVVRGWICKQKTSRQASAA